MKGGGEGRERVDFCAVRSIGIGLCAYIAITERS